VNVCKLSSCFLKGGKMEGGYARRIPQLKAGLLQKVVGLQVPKKLVDYDLKAEPSFKRDNKFGVINQIEQGVSLLQTANLKIEKIRVFLVDLVDFLESLQYKESLSITPISVVNNFIADRIWKIRMAAQEANFNGRAILNGGVGVSATTQGKQLVFVKGSSKNVSSEKDGYPVAIHRLATKTKLVGVEPLTEESLKLEKMISLFEGNNEVHYQIKRDENPESLVRNLQECFINNGLDLTVVRTKDNYLVFIHNQFGSHIKFLGVSHNTRIISPQPGKAGASISGVDIRGTIGDEFAIGRGAFLIGARGNKKTDGLVVHYDGPLDYSGQVIGIIYLKQNGIHVPIKMKEKETDILSIPSMSPESHSIGVANHSGFTSLAKIQGNSKAQCLDSLKIVNWALDDLDYTLQFLKSKETFYIERAIELLRSSLVSDEQGKPDLMLSKAKASDMADQLKDMLISSIS
jgi:hypothetical protein